MKTLFRHRPPPAKSIEPRIASSRERALAGARSHVPSSPLPRTLVPHLLVLRSHVLRSLVSGLSLFAFNAAATLSFAQDATPPPKPAVTQSEKAVAAKGERGSVGVAERAAGSITGQVVDEERRPLANVSLYVFSRGSNAGQQRGSVATAEDGRFVFDNLEPGVYNLNVQVPGYTFESAASINLTGHRVGDFVTLRMVRGGVVTGTVTDADGTPLVAAPVRAIFIRELEGTSSVGAAPPFTFAREFQTDDRGVYRIYGLMPGVYVVAAGASVQRRPFFNAFESGAPTFYPSATMDAASEVVVRTGQEVSGIDIRHRGEDGHTVSGRLEGALESTAPQQSGASVMMVHAATGAMMGQAWTSGREGERSFSFYGVADGDYELRAQRTGRAEEWNVGSAPQRVAVRGADVTGLKLTLAPRASLGGKVVLEPLPPVGVEGMRDSCTDSGRRLLPQEVIVTARPDEREATTRKTRTRLSSRSSEAVPDAHGEFTMLGLDPGLYRVAARSLSEDWYVRAVGNAPATTTTTATAKQPTKQPTKQATAGGAATRELRTGAGEVKLGDGLIINTGQQVRGLIVTLAEGAAQVRGRVATAAATEGEGARAAAHAPTAHTQTRVHLVPAERERAGDVLHFHEAATVGDGTFTLSNLAPGRYFIIARAERPPATGETFVPPVAWDADARAALRREAEQGGVAIDLKPCQRVIDYALRRPAADR